MKRITARWFSFAFIALLLSPALGTVAHAQAPASQANSMSIWQARRTLTTKPNKVKVNGWYGPIRFSPESFEYDVMNSKKVPQTVRVDLATAPVVIADCWRTQCRLSLRFIPKNTGLRDYLERFDWYDLDSATCTADCVHAAETFAAALNVLRTFALDSNAPLRTFSQRAAAWRALATKPPIPEEVRVQRLMAEDAFKENKPAEALNYYELGIQLYPTWPEGNFNAALIAGELGSYADAIEHMQAYLELVPDAADAQAARDKILIWRVKAKQ
jgi:hypothetical protein